MPGTRREKSASQPCTRLEKTDVSESESNDEEIVLRQKWTPASRKGKKYVCNGGNEPCGKTITNRTESLMCDGCGMWYHASCQGISAGAFQALNKFGDELTWLCVSCKPKLAWIHTGNNLEKRIEEAEKKILNEMEKVTSESIKKRINDMEREITKKMLEQKAVIEVNSQALNKVAKEQKDMEEKVVKRIGEQQQTIESSSQMMRKAAQSKDMENRAVNIIIHNVEESTEESGETRKKHDHEKFKEIADSLGGEGAEVESIIRLKRKDDGENKKARLMLVKMKRAEEADMLFRRRYNLKSKGFENIYITKDMPPEEREKLRKLRIELNEKGKENYVIFRGKVVPKQPERKTTSSNKEARE